MGKNRNSYPPSDLEFAVSSFAGRAPPPPPDASWVAWLTPSFAIANVISFAYSMYVNDCPSNHSDDPSACVFYPSLGRYAFEPVSFNALLGPSLHTLDKLGALDYKKIVYEGERWRLISCIWLHAGVFHLLANMFTLLFVGVRLEQEFGFGVRLEQEFGVAKIGTLYILSGFGGSLMSCLSIKTKLSVGESGTMLSVGASGALFGWMGAMVSELFINWSIYANKCAALLTLIVVIAINMAVGIIPNVDSSAHIGGFISGFLLGFILLIRPQLGWISRERIPPGFDIHLIKPKYKVYQLLLWVFALIALIIWLVCHMFAYLSVLSSPKFWEERFSMGGALREFLSCMDKLFHIHNKLLNRVFFA